MRTQLFHQTERETFLPLSIVEDSAVCRSETALDDSRWPRGCIPLLTRDNMNVFALRPRLAFHMAAGTKYLRVTVTVRWVR